MATCKLLDLYLTTVKVSTELTHMIREYPVWILKETINKILTESGTVHNIYNMSMALTSRS